MDILPDMFNGINGSGKLANISKLAQHLPIHVSLKEDVWYVSLWKEKDCPLNPRHLDTDIPKYLLEREFDKVNNRNTTIYPKKDEVTNNVIHNVGMRASIDNDIAAATSNIDYMGVGTSSAAEDVTHDDLTTEITGGGYTRRQLSTGGTRTRPTGTQLMKLGHSFNDTQVGATIPVTLREVGVFRHVSNPDVCHARAVISDFTLDTGDLFVAFMTELHENGVL